MTLSVGKARRTYKVPYPELYATKEICSNEVSEVLEGYSTKIIIMLTNMNFTSLLGRPQSVQLYSAWTPEFPRESAYLPVSSINCRSQVSNNRCHCWGILLGWPCWILFRVLHWQAQRPLQV
jgi:hypothetical protein